MRFLRNYRGLGGAMCAFHVFRGYQPAQTTIIIGVWGARCAYFTCVCVCVCVWRVWADQNHYNYRGLGGAMCVSHVFGGYRPAKTTTKIGVQEQPNNCFAYKTPAKLPILREQSSNDSRSGGVGGVGEGLMS